MEEEKKETETKKVETQDPKKKNNLKAIIIAIIVIICVLVVGLCIVKNNSGDGEKSNSKDNLKTIKVSKSYLVDDAKEKNTKRYWADITSSLFSSYEEDDYDEDYMKDFVKLSKAEINFYVNDNEVVEVVFALDLTDFCKKFAKDYKDEMEDLDLEDAKDVEEYFTDAMNDSFSSSAGKSYTDGGKIFFVAAGDDLEDAFGDDDDYDVEDFAKFKDTFEDEMDVKLKKIN